LLAQVCGLGIETADVLAHAVFSRLRRDPRAVAQYGGLTGSPDKSGSRRREQGLARAGKARGRCGRIQRGAAELVEGLIFQKDSALVRWYWRRTADARGDARKTMSVALARKRLVALWRRVTTGEVPEGVVLRPAP